MGSRLKDKEEARTANMRLASCGVQWLNQALCFYQSFCLVDSEVLRNRHLRVAAKRCVALNGMTIKFLFILAILTSLSAFGQTKSKFIDQGNGKAINTLDSLLKSNIQEVAFWYQRRNRFGSLLEVRLTKNNNNYDINYFECEEYYSESNPSLGILYRCDSTPFFHIRKTEQMIIDDLNNIALKDTLYDPSTIQFRTKHDSITIENESEARLIKSYFYKLTENKK